MDTKTGKRRLEFETEMCGEAEGLDDIRTLGGDLHWLLSPIDDCQLTYPPSSALLHLVRRPGKPRLSVKVCGVGPHGVRGARASTWRVDRAGRPVRGARVSFAGAHARTNRRGVAPSGTRSRCPGASRRSPATAAAYGLSGLLPLGFE